MANKRKNSRGGAMLELVLFAPWIFFLFVGALDWGFYSYALISVENAARVAALYTSTGTGTQTDQSTACDIVKAELQALPNIGASFAGQCGAAPLTVTAVSADSGKASRVTVTYRTVRLIPIPGLLGSQFTFSRSVQMMLRS